ncbi:MAG: UDP-N-acetylmuramoyl-L-alanine--D-glutamate ligase [Candidatus Kerfeldbacteria bacterium]|nr:UDP-N-acetylmuramoyl-L-alanine--D-glutamate ligase [Candidatus Kerfeldbacteria bacterium]
MSVLTRPAIIRPRLFSRFPELVVGARAVWQGRQRFVRAAGPRVDRRRADFFRQLGVPPEKVVFGEQVHGRRVVFVPGLRPTPGRFVPRADGLVTDRNSQSLGVFTADCVPVVAYDPVQRLVGVAHAGWRGLVSGVIDALVRTMAAHATAPRSLWMWFGPSAGPCCYDVPHSRDRRAQQFFKRFGGSTVIHRKEGTFLNLRRAAVLQAVTAGVPRSHLEISQHCTIHDRPRLPSARRQAATRRRSLVVVAGLRDPFTFHRGRRVLVVGLGLHGGAASAVRWFVGRGARVRVTDRKPAGQLAPTIRRLRGLPVQYHLGGHRRADVQWADVVYQNQGVPSASAVMRLSRQLSRPIVNELSLFLRLCPALVVGVTGTRGKSSVAFWLYQMLRRRFNRVVLSGNIARRPMLSLLHRLTPKHIVVLELSSFQLEFLPDAARSPHLAVMTNLLVDHLDRYRTLSHYAAAKYNLFRYQTPRDFAVLNYDSSRARAVRQMTPATVIWFSRVAHPPGWSLFSTGSKLVEQRGGRRAVLVTWTKNIQSDPARQSNLLAAVSAARALNVPASAIRRTLLRLPGLPHRQELVRRWRGHAVVNDSASTTPDATLAALESFPDGLFIVGGTDKRLRFRMLAESLARRRTPLVLLPGTASRKLLKELRRVRYAGQRTQASSMRDAVRRATSMARPRQPIVLSPGAASFGLFRHEFDRGDQFRRAVSRLRP